MKTLICKYKTIIINKNYIVDVVKYNDKVSESWVFINLINKKLKIKTDKANSLIEYLKNDSKVEFTVDNIE